MKQILACLFIFSFVFSAFSQQKIAAKDSYAELQQIESNIKGYSDEMINGKHWYLRFVADSLFTRGLVKALKVKNSFSYRFDSLETVSKIYAPDSSFRIFTWQMMRDYTYYRQRGAIQMHTSDGSLKLFPLFDVSDFTTAPNDSIRDTRNWIGAIYYRILMHIVGDKKIYTLFGFDENGPRSNKKWIEILTFDEEGIPHFGGDYFKFETAKKDTAKASPILRYSVEYKKEARLKLNYDKDENMIVYDHVSSESEDPKNLYTYVPDGSYEGFKWTGDKWEHVSKLPTQVLGNGNAPLDNAILDNDGNVDQARLDEMIKKNRILQLDEDKEKNKPADKKLQPKKPQPKPQPQNEY